MKKIKTIAKQLWQDESGQGTAEYVLILVGVVGVAFVFKDHIKKIVGDKLEALKGSIDAFNPR